MRPMPDQSNPLPPKRGRLQTEARDACAAPDLGQSDQPFRHFEMPWRSCCAATSSIFRSAVSYSYASANLFGLKRKFPVQAAELLRKS